VYCLIAIKNILQCPYDAIPVGDLTSTTAYIDVTGIQYGGTPSVLGTVHSTTGNKVYFGTDLKLEWESIFINTL
jgi:hypothetical protein